MPGAAIVSLVRSVGLQRAESDVAVSAISLRLFVQRTVRGGRRSTSGCGRRGLRCGYRGWRGRRSVHPHVSVQRDLLVRAVRAMRTGVRLPHFEFAGLLVVLVVRGVLLQPRPMGAVEGAVRL